MASLRQQQPSWENGERVEAKSRQASKQASKQASTERDVASSPAAKVDSFALAAWDGDRFGVEGRHRVFAAADDRCDEWLAA